jgi:hypothetical protein
MSTSPSHRPAAPLLLTLLLLLGATPLALLEAQEHPTDEEAPPPTAVEHKHHSKNVAPGADDKPVVVADVPHLYQGNQAYASLFSAKGKSNICGPTSLASVLVYFRDRKEAPFARLLPNQDHDSKETATVETLFKLCKTNRETGTGAPKMLAAAAAALKQAGYSSERDYALGLQMKTAPPTLDDLKKLKARIPACLHVGWYFADPVGPGGSPQFVRDNGHWVVLVGFDEKDDHVLYVTNPSIDYESRSVAKSGRTISRMELKPVPTDAARPAKVDATTWAAMWATNDLGSVTGIVEDLVVIDPQ